MDRDAYASLSPRERECLRLVAQGLQSKEIAARLSEGGAGLTPGTVDGYIKSAAAKLGVSNRRDAARVVAAVEGTAPQWLAPQAPGVEAEAFQSPSLPVSTGGRAPWLRLPFRRPGERDNDLVVAERLLWIVFLTIAMAIGFGMLTSGLKVMADLFGTARLLTNS